MSAQHKIGSGFGHDSTADDVLAGIDLNGKLAIVTGGYSGLGLETTKALTKAGARVVVPARRPDVAKDALAGVDGVEIDELDLGDLDSVRAFAERFLASERSIDFIIDNAAIMGGDVPAARRSRRRVLRGLRGRGGVGGRPVRRPAVRDRPGVGRPAVDGVGGAHQGERVRIGSLLGDKSF